MTEHSSSEKEQVIKSGVYPRLSGDTERLEKLIAVLRQTKLGTQLLDDAAEAGVTITTATMHGSHGAYNDANKLVTLAPGASFDRQVVTLAHELRHAQQFKNGVLLNAFKDVPRDYLHSQGLIEADANVASCVVAWDLKQQGNSKPMEEFAQEHPLIANPFLQTAEKGGVETGQAQKDAFYGWFDDLYIRNAYEKNYLRNFECNKRHATLAERETAMLRSVPVTENAAKICNIDGKPYLSEKEVKDFFGRPELTSVAHETFWAIYRNLRDIKHFDFSADAKEVMKKEGNFTIRESDYYEVASPLRQRQTNAAAKIAEYKRKSLNSSKLSAAVIAVKRKNALEK